MKAVNHSDNTIFIEGLIAMLESKYTMRSMLDHFIIKRNTREGRPCCQCPHCNSTHTVLYGKSGIRQRHLCRSCHRTFNDFTKTPFAYAHFPDKLIAFIKCSLEGMSLRDSSRKLKVSYVTLFYWRHKLLLSLKNLSTGKMKDNVEIEYFYMKYSRKGQKHRGNNSRVHDRTMSYFNIEGSKVCVLTALDFFKNIYSKAVCVGYLNISHIESSLGNILSSDNIICSRRRTVFGTFFKRKKLKEAKENLSNSNIIIKYIKGFRKWMKPFNGVATKYLNNYISLYRFVTIGDFRDAFSGVKNMLDVICTVNNTYTYKSVTNDEINFNN